MSYTANGMKLDFASLAQPSQSRVHRARSGSSGEITKTPELPLRAL